MTDRLPASREIVGDAVAVAAQVVAAAPALVQDELFTAPAIPEADAGLERAEIAAEGDRRRKAGRPPGAQNKSTKQLREWLLRGGVLPQKWMMDFLLIEPEQLALRLQCTIAEAFDRQVAIADKLAPYVMSRMAPSDDKGNSVPFFEFHQNTFVAGGEAVPPWELDRAKRVIVAGLKPVIDGTAAEVEGEARP